MRINGPYIHNTGRLKGRRYLNIIGDNGKRTSVLYSRWLMEQHLGRKLSFDETVDHIDGDPTNDDLSNLQILTRAQNAAKYFVDANIVEQIIELECLRCSKKFTRLLRYEAANRRKGRYGPFCGKSCAGKWSREKQLGRVA